MAATSRSSRLAQEAMAVPRPDRPGHVAEGDLVADGRGRGQGDPVGDDPGRGRQPSSRAWRTVLGRTRSPPGQPRLQAQAGPSSSTTTWPTWPALPLVPW